MLSRSVTPEEEIFEPICRCQIVSLVDSQVFDDRTTTARDYNERADELAEIRLELTGIYSRIDRGECLDDWVDQLKTETAELVSLRRKLVDAARKREAAAWKQRKEEREEQLRKAAAKEVEKKPGKARFLGSFSGLKWL